MESCRKKLVLEAETTGFKDPAGTARSPQREKLCWKGSVGRQWLYTHESRRAKKLIPVTLSEKGTASSCSLLGTGRTSTAIGENGKGEGRSRSTSRFGLTSHSTRWSSGPHAPWPEPEQPKGRTKRPAKKKTRPAVDPKKRSSLGSPELRAKRFLKSRSLAETR